MLNEMKSYQLFMNENEKLLIIIQIPAWKLIGKYRLPKCHLSECKTRIRVAYENKPQNSEQKCTQCTNDSGSVEMWSDSIVSLGNLVLRLLW